MGIASFTEDYRNRIAVVGLQDERVLVEDNYPDYSDFVTLAEAHHGFPATSLQWQPSTAPSFAWSQKSVATELLATTGDALRVWEYMSEGQVAGSSYVGRTGSGSGSRLQLKTCLSGVSVIHIGLKLTTSATNRSHLRPSSVVRDGHSGYHSNRKCKIKTRVPR